MASKQFWENWEVSRAEKVCQLTLQESVVFQPAGGKKGIFLFLTFFQIDRIEIM